MSSKKTRVSAEYIWIHDNEMYSKTRTIEIQGLEELEVKNISKWSFNSLGEELTLTPINIFNCPFRGQNGILVFCKTNNTKLLSKNKSGSYSMSQEYYIINPNLMRPYGFLSLVNPDTGLNYVSGVGLQKCYGRKFADLHYKLCIASGIKISSMTSSNSPSKWEYVVDSTSINDLSAHFWLSRYILHRVGENCNVIMDINPTNLDNRYWNPTKCKLNNNGEITEYNGECDLYNIF